MKKIVQIAVVLFVGLNCKAQSPVFDITDFNNTAEDIYGAYHKDINNLLDPFEGTYIYTSGNTSLKIVLQKKIMSSMNRHLYEDLIVGEYQYIENGIEKINTLDQLNSDDPNKRKHSIDGNFIITKGDPGCEDCLSNEKALYAGLVENTTGNTALFIIRRVSNNDTPAIEIDVMWKMKHKNENDQPLPRPTFPGGHYILKKQ